MDVRAENRGRPHQKVSFPAAPVAGRNFLTPGHPGVRVGNVRGKSGPKSLCLCFFFFPDYKHLFFAIHQDFELSIFNLQMYLENPKHDLFEAAAAGPAQPEPAFGWVLIGWVLGRSLIFIAKITSKVALENHLARQFLFLNVKIALLQ